MRPALFTRHATLAIIGAFLFLPAPSHADILCIKKKQKVKKNTVRLQKILQIEADECPKGFVELLNTSAFQGPAGADGSIRIYGDGSAGDLVVGSNTTLTDPNQQFADITINASTTLTVQSGTVLRCSGRFVNNGTISVKTFAQGGQSRPVVTKTIQPAMSPPHPGVGYGASQSGEAVVDNTEGANGGNSSIVDLSESHARSLLLPGIAGGGGGAAGGVQSSGGSGGGTLTVLCAGLVQNNGTIIANGADGNFGGGGGGAGGVVVIASPTSVTNAGTITANGGNGSDSDSSAGAGGGGGGGIIHLISPTISVSGASTATGGAAGSNATMVTDTPRGAGGAGGSCAGAGGSGSNVGAGTPASVSSAGDGNDGQILTTEADPTSLF